MGSREARARPSARFVTGETVEQQLHGADVQVQLVHMVLAEVPDLQVPEENHNHHHQLVQGTV